MKRLTYLLLCLLMPAMAAAENAPVKYLSLIHISEPTRPY